MNCTSVYSTKGSLTTHLKYECGQPPRFKCPYCDLVSKKTSNVQQHIRRRHKDRVVYVQDITHPSNIRYNIHKIFPFDQPFFGQDVSRLYARHEVRFPCPNCNSVFNRKNNLQKHLKYECGQLPRFKCPHCLYRSKKTSNVRAHIRGLHSGSEVYVIDLNASLNYCTLATIPPGTWSYVLHSYPSSMMTTSTTEMRTSIKIKDMDKKKFPCTKCSSVFSRKGGLTYHQKNECGQEPRFSCPYCVYRAGHVSNARRHVKKCHPGQLVYAVDLGELQKRDNIGWHHKTQRTSCEDSPLVEATQLGRTVEILKILLLLFLMRYCSRLHEKYQGKYSSRSARRRCGANRSVHKAQRQTCKQVYYCPRCGGSFNWRYNLQHHLKFACGQSPRFNCPYCPFRTKHTSNVRAHVRRKHPDREVYVIDILSWQQPSESVPSRTWRKGSNRLVANNITISSREQNAKSFPCGNCNSVFSMKHNLQYHWRIECGQPPRYNCPYCAYRTKHPSNVRAHVRQTRPVAMQRFHAHSNQCVYNPDGAQRNRNYPCHKCGNAFTRKNNLYNHLKFQCGQLPRFNCPYCSYRTNIKPCYVRLSPIPREFSHLLKHHIHLLRKRVFCLNKCGRSFVNVASMASHLHDCDRYYFDCPFCNYRIDPYNWLPAVSLRSTRSWCHRTSNWRKKFHCTNNCGSRFTHRGSLNRHMLYECQQNPRFKCPTCDFRSKWTSDVYKHVRKKHQGSVVRCIDIGRN
ncbi:hypothetical protein ALC62_05604 [Cyphomyrmex costatus]|uniref:C2H2-type domain-containing protein n=1 Tax=Cyphomyrmex costatus TaxID=456900 RepID=A0A195CSH7_9HYME|nr:hypothetical protein ALC62_05604 [Cyphomyrmex costatus]